MGRIAMESRNGLFATTAAVEAGTGLALLIVPALVLQLLLGVASASPTVLLVGRVVGAALLIFGAAAWRLRQSRGARSQTGLLYLMLAYNVGIAIVLAAAYGLKGLSGILLWPVVLLHSAMAVWCLYELRAGRRLA
jgi:hypothetical protein